MGIFRDVGRIIIYIFATAAVLALLAAFVFGSYFDSWNVALGFGILAIGLVMLVFKKKLGWIFVVAGIAFLGFADTT